MSFFRRLIILLKPMWNIYKINTWVQISLGIPGGSAVKYPPASAGDEGSILGSERSPREGNGNPLQYSCLENTMDRGAWQDTVHGVAKRWTWLKQLSSSSSSSTQSRASLVAQMVKNLLAIQETWVWSLGGEDPLEKEMATRSSILAWRILWTEEPGGLQSMGSQRVWYDWVTNTLGR